MTNQREVFNAREAVRELGISYPTIFEWLSKGYIQRSHEENGKLYFTRKDLNQALDLFRERIKTRGWYRKV